MRSACHHCNVGYAMKGLLCANAFAIIGNYGSRVPREQIMNSVSLGSSLAYGRELVSAGISGIRIGEHEFGEESMESLVTTSARDSVKTALAGAFLALIPLMARRRRCLSRAIALGALGSAVGFCAGFGWKTRSVASCLAHSAAKEVGRVRDQHWLEHHPIDYA